MTELKNNELELDRFRGRVLAAAAFVLFAFGLLAARLVYLQVFRHDELQTQAENNRISVIPIVPNRGLILDRNGVVLATNYSAYTLEITASKVADLEGTINDLTSVIDITPRDRRRFKKMLDESKGFDPLPIRTKLTDEEVARFTAQHFRFPGVEIKARLFRRYPYGEVASHVLGYIGRINEKEQEALEEQDDDVQANYRGTDYIGKLGIEQSYERELHGKAGFEEVEISAAGRAVRRLKSSAPVAGNTLQLSIDIKLQQMVEQLYGDRRGALVAMDPRTGEILAFVSKPTFDPNLFVDGIDSDSWKDLNESIDKPLLNRALRGTYPPGSTYKPFMALAALETGKRTPSQAISDPGYFWFGNHKFRDDKEGGHGIVDMYRSIVASCDTYYYMLANDLGVDTIAEHMAPFGFGQITGIDIEGEVRGLLPSTDWKRKAYRRPEQKKWYAGETISLGIGQGYNSFTILQMAQALSTLSSGGVRFKPHLVHEIEDVVGGAKRPANAEPLPTVPINAQHLAVIRNALVGVNREGTSAAAFRDAGYTSGGKTGTAQVVGIKKDEKYSASKLAEHLRDHALYIAYAPAETPKIVVALIVENAGWGAQSAAPIARRVFDYWLMQQLPTDQDIAAVSTGGTPLPPKRVAAAEGSASGVAAIPVSSVTVASRPAGATAAATTAAAATARLVAESVARPSSAPAAARPGASAPAAARPAASAAAANRPAASTPAAARPAASAPAANRPAASAPAAARPAASASSRPANAATGARAASTPAAVRPASAAPKASASPARTAPSPTRPASGAAHPAASTAPRAPAPPASKPNR